MSLSQIAVQAGHAVGAFCKALPEEANEIWDDTLVYLGVDNEIELNRWIKVLEGHDYSPVLWTEGYWNNSLTSLAVLGSPKVKELVKELKLV
jgi:hypothetical protein